MNHLIIFRIFLFIVLAGVWYGGFWIVGSIATVAYLFRFAGYEVVILGLCLDIQFMTGFVPWYTISFLASFLIIQLMKTQLLAYNN